VLKTLKILLEQEREIVKIAAENDDEGTVSLISGFIEEQEKSIWMLSALLK